MSICLVAAGATTRLAVAAFTLSWTHSVEKTRWEEDWKVSGPGLQIVEARVKGSGAGMEPPPEARWQDGWWRYAPGLPPQRELVLAASGATGDGWTLCVDGACRVIGASGGPPVVLRSCADQ